MDASVSDDVSLLQHPKAQALLADAVVESGDVRGCARRLTAFVADYLPLFGRSENRDHAAVAVRGRLSGLERKTSGPIAAAADIHRRQIQDFVGAGRWNDDLVMARIRRHVAQELGDPDAVVVVDGSAFGKSGTESCGVKRQWNGRLGKLDNCQVGVFAAYAAAGGHAPLDRRLFLPADWAADPARRKKTYVPAGVVHKQKWRMALDQLADWSKDVPHGWVAADDEFGRSAEFRAELRERGERYVLDVPCNTQVRDLEQPAPRRRRRGGRRPKRPFVRADAWAQALPAEKWMRLTVRPGSAGPLTVEAATVRVTAKDRGRIGPEERLLVVRTVGGQAKTSYHLSNAGPEVPPAELVRAHAERHRIEEMFARAKGEAGLADYEVRSWTGWHHHMTLSLLALWYLVIESRAMGEKNPGDHGVANPSDHDGAAPRAATDVSQDRQAGQRRAATEREGPNLQVA